MVILGAVQGELLAGVRSPRTTLVLGAAYTLWMYKRVIFGEVANDHVAALQDVNAREFWSWRCSPSRCSGWASTRSRSPT